MKYFKQTLVLCTTALAPFAAFADELNSGDTAWMLTSSALVLFMLLPGLSLFYAGLVRSKNVLSVLMQCFSIACAMSILWFLVGYSLAFSGDGAWIGNLDKAFLKGVSFDSMSGTIPESVFVVFQMTFIMITPALFVGGFAERMNFAPMFVFSILWSLIVYVPVTHWVWGGGWLAEKGLLDFAGGTVVHVTAGVSALVAALVVGNRTGFPERPMTPHSMALTVAGAGMLWFGWFGFNGGSAVAANGGAGMAMLVTHLSAAAGSLAWMAIEWIRFRKPSVLGIVTGMVAGLGTITPASGFVGPMGGVIIGLCGGTVCYFATQLIKSIWKIDDSLDVFPVHGVGGALGTILAAVFVSSSWGGVGYAQGMGLGSQLGVQVLGVVATGVYAAVVSYVLLKVIAIVLPLRADAEIEQQGLDVTQHCETGYNL
ncbi:ammonium transporter [Arenicella sp. 4NH20-0111]|uniref:ammonium transporter n=1 Tax=Arenicella sp. 4NH20-0111 TaxID=3127648 RepID=UPI00310A43FD